MRTVPWRRPQPFRGWFVAGVDGAWFRVSVRVGTAFLNECPNKLIYKLIYNSYISGWTPEKTINMYIPPLNIVRIIIPVVFRLLSVDVGVDTSLAWQRHNLSLQTLRRQPKYAYTMFRVSVICAQASSVTTWRCSAGLKWHCSITQVDFSYSHHA